MFRPQHSQNPADDPQVQAALFEMKTVSDLFAKMSNAVSVLRFAIIIIKLTIT